jgi:hypothetical protein
VPVRRHLAAGDRAPDLLVQLTAWRLSVVHRAWREDGARSGARRREFRALDRRRRDPAVAARGTVAPLPHAGPRGARPGRSGPAFR